MTRSLATLEAARQRRAETAAELRALLEEEAASLAREQVAPSSPGLLTAWALRAIDRLNTARAIGVAFSGDSPEGQRVRRAEAAEAFPNGK